jgi:hypothetical protein
MITDGPRRVEKTRFTRIWQSLRVVGADNDYDHCTESREKPMRKTCAPICAYGGLALAIGLGLVASTGCQVDLNGQTLPSGYYLADDVQYFPPGPEFKLAREAAAMKAYQEEQAAQSRGVSAGLPTTRR